MKILYFYLALITFDTQGSANISRQIIDNEKSKNFLKDGNVWHLEEQKWYLGGRRVFGDSLKQILEETYKLDQLNDFYLELNYSTQNEFQITHISALVQQSSRIGSAYITDGGIGTSYIRLIFEAKRTNFFYYKIYLYGK